MNLKMVKATFAGLIILISGFANATLIGQSIYGCTDSTYNSGSASVDTALCDSVSTSFETSALVQDSAAEFFLSDDRVVDFSADTISLIFTNVGSPSPDLFVFTNLWDALPSIEVIGLELISSNILDVTTAFNANSIGLLVNSPRAGNTTVTFRILTNTTIPEPSTLAIFALGIMGLASRRFKKQ